MSKTLSLNLVILIMLIILILAMITNLFGAVSIYLIIVLPILMLTIGLYVLITNVKKYNSNNNFNNKL